MKAANGYRGVALGQKNKLGIVTLCLELFQRSDFLRLEVIANRRDAQRPRSFPRITYEMLGSPEWCLLQDSEKIRRHLQNDYTENLLLSSRGMG
jgi:hypothetical protein